MNARRRAPLACIALLLAAQRAAASSGPPGPAAPPDEPREVEVSDYHRAGPIFYRADLRVRGIGYDDNVFLDREEPRGDVTASLGPELRGVVRLGRGAWVGVHGSVDFNGFARHRSLSHVDDSQGADATVWLGDLRLRASASRAGFVRRPSSEVDVRVRADAVERTAGLRFEPSVATALEASVERRDLRYDTVDGVDYDHLLGRAESAAKLSARRRVAPLTWAALDLGAALQKAPPAPGAVGDRDLRRGSAEVGLDFAPGALLEGGFRFGLARVAAEDPPGAGHQGFRGTSGRASILARLGSRDRAGVTFGRTFTPSTYADNVFFRNDAAGLWWLHEITSRVAAEAGVERGWHVYPVAAPDGRRDRTWETQVGARVRLGRGTVLALRVSRWTRRSSLPEEDRDRIVFEQSLVLPL